MQEWFHFIKVGIKSVWITTVPSPFYRVASKILKRAVQIQLLQHLDNSSQLSPFQCAGLRKNHSIQDAVSYFTDCFRKGIACSRRLDSGEQVKSYAASAKRNRALSFARSPFSPAPHHLNVRLGKALTKVVLRQRCLSTFEKPLTV